MVQTDISQLSHECNTWRENLRNYREQFTDFKKRLQHAAGSSLSKDLCPEVEHYHNQFHIQLINIHDLKQTIKQHDRKLSTEANDITDETLADHENISDQYASLKHTLHDLQIDFNRFLQKLT